jgi:hypothetical protein
MPICSVIVARDFEEMSKYFSEDCGLPKCSSRLDCEKSAVTLMYVHFGNGVNVNAEVGCMLLFWLRVWVCVGYSYVTAQFLDNHLSL